MVIGIVLDDITGQQDHRLFGSGCVQRSIDITTHRLAEAQLQHVTLSVVVV